MKYIKSLLPTVALVFLFIAGCAALDKMAGGVVSATAVPTSQPTTAQAAVQSAAIIGSIAASAGFPWAVAIPGGISILSIAATAYLKMRNGQLTNDVAQRNDAIAQFAQAGILTADLLAKVHPSVASQVAKSK